MRLVKVSVMLLAAALAGCNAKQGLALTPKSEADKLVLKRLNERIRKLDFDNTDLKDVIQSFRHVSGVNIYVHWKAVEAAGPKRNTPVKMHVQDVPFHEALTQCLGSLKSRTPITYALADGVVLISTPEDAAELARQINARLAVGKTEAEKRALKWRNERIRELNFDDIELRDILEFLKDHSGPGAYVRWSRPKPAGVDGPVLVKVHLRDVTLHTALTLCLADAGGGKPVSYIIKDGEIHISTPEDAARRARLIGAPPPAGKTEADKRVLTRLNETIRELNFNNIELQDVIEFFREASGLSIHVEWNTLKSVGVAKHTTVNVRLQDVPVYAALSLCLAGAAGEEILGYIIKDGAIHISTPGSLKKLREGAPEP